MYDAIIVGTGPSGLMCANILKNKNILVLEKMNKPGSKLLITGGGRCNLTNLVDNKIFLENVSYNKKYLYSTINNFGPNEVYNYFSKFTKLKVEDDNKVFPSNDKSSTILNILTKDIQNKINYNEKIENIIYNDNIKVITNKTSYITKNLVLALGGCSYKITGSSGDIKSICKNLDLDFIPFFPAMTSIIVKEKNDLAGTSFDNVVIKNKKIKTTGNLIYTHKGLSGSSIFKISELIYLNNLNEIFIDFLPNISIDELNNLFNKNNDIFINTFLKEYFSKRFITYLLDKINIENKKIKEINKKSIINLINNIKNMCIKDITVSNINLAYVTGGGVDLKELNTKDFSLKKYPNIYVVGESTDIHGPTGGYNITLALSTGYSAGTSIKNKYDKILKLKQF